MLSAGQLPRVSCSMKGPLAHPVHPSPSGPQVSTGPPALSESSVQGCGILPEPNREHQSKEERGGPGMGILEWGHCAGLAASRPGPGPRATTFLRIRSFPRSKQAGKRALAEALAKHSGTFVSSWLSPQLPPFLVIACKEPREWGSRQESSSQTSWPSSPPSASRCLSLAFKA